MQEFLVFRAVKKSIPVSENGIKKIAKNVIDWEHRIGSLSIHLIGESRMRDLQKRYRGKHSATDVLSFPAQEGFWIQKNTELGDIFLCPAKIKVQAKKWDVPYREEFIRMLIHGILHILGYDHIAPRESRNMFKRQEKYLNSFL